MKTKEELIEIMAKAICVQRLIEENDYPERQPTDATSEWYRKLPNRPQQIWELYKPEAEAALKALCGALPDVHTEHKHNPNKNALNTIAECAANYCELVKWGENESNN